MFRVNKMITAPVKKFIVFESLKTDLNFIAQNPVFDRNFCRIDDVKGYSICLCQCHALDIQHKAVADDKRSNIFDIVGRYIMPASDKCNPFGSLQQGDGTAWRYTGVDMFMVPGTMYDIECILLYRIIDFN